MHATVRSVIRCNQMMIHGTYVPRTLCLFPCIMSGLPKRCSFDENPKQVSSMKAEE
ncbi:hypothetical protein GQ55_4G090800 [Panicum hallii var. hallii]|uniref:Uncharacterized protein n=1 Tax=Panicum hallii var. hallii TaxID=1504633 RepID=A0A2T7DWT1_9POAL|nr:hypothetical protein GQ55_4G090800 [Panicum hallii var. hallii]